MATAVSEISKKVEAPRRVSTHSKSVPSSTQDIGAPTTPEITPMKNNDESKCGKCDVVIGPDDMALNCDICKVWFHIGCQKFPEAVYKFMVEKEEGKQLDWKCCFCKRGYENLHAYMKEIEGQQSKMLARQDTLEVEMQEIRDSVKEEMGKSKTVENRLVDVEGKIINLEEQNTDLEAKIKQVYPLTLLYRRSLQLGELPLDWKEALVSPIYKKGAKNLAANYRPISLAAILCKILESIICEVLLDHMLKNNALSPKQYGFIHGRSTVLQMLHYLNHCYEIVARDGVVDVIYLDYAKAFDSVPHRRLLSKLMTQKSYDQLRKGKTLMSYNMI
ncbi:hypothetical protein Pmani_000326 [Petrolisthes manimaculis]|uniref:PHD-type domain-containing protein n=1 Tax=Petrolisthes manimaculis TaxID=1843537 RepID=A0AAE1QQB8_9EUCA|nr:hypothetical protein Pmani_000326 [Petrolisthes manimaculis]